MRYALLTPSEVIERPKFLFQDDPHRIAQTLVDFWRRNERLILPNIKKVGEV